jgi:hypothetical protein
VSAAAAAVATTAATERRKYIADRMSFVGGDKVF